MKGWVNFMFGEFPFVMICVLALLCMIKRIYYLADVAQYKLTRKTYKLRADAKKKKKEWLLPYLDTLKDLADVIEDYGEKREHSIILKTCTIIRLCLEYDVPEYMVQHILGYTLPNYAKMFEEIQKLRLANYEKIAIKSQEKTYTKHLKAFTQEVDLKLVEVRKLIEEREIVSKSDFDFQAAVEALECSMEHEHKELSEEESNNQTESAVHQQMMIAE